MARTSFSGPVASANGFEGNVTGVASAAASVSGPVTLRAFTTTTLPPVVVGGLIYVSNANSDAGTVCFGKGTSWIDISTGVAVVA
jgi:hypothetical protein